MSPLPARAYQIAEVAVLGDEYTPLPQRALHHLFSGYPFGGFDNRPFPGRCWRWSAGSWFDSPSERNASPGSSSTQSLSSEIPPTTRPSTCSIVLRDCYRIRTE